MLHPRHKLPPDLHPPAGVRAQPLPIIGGPPLSLWVYDTTAPRGLIIACHGYHANQRQLAGLAQGLQRRGYTVITCTSRGHGVRGGRTTFGRDEVPDVASLLDWARCQGPWQALPAGIIGWSFGGALALQVASRRQDIRAVILDSSYATLFPIVAKAIRRDYHLPAPFACLTWWGAQLALRVRLSAVDPAKLAARLTRPLLVIHGAADASVPLAHANQVYAAWQGPKQQWVVPGAPHVGAFDADPQQYCDRVAAFCDQWLS